MCRRLVLLTMTFSVLVQPSDAAFSASTAASPTASAGSSAAHVLNRLAFGARPGDLERVQATGIPAWIELQLHPERLDDRALDTRLASFRTLALDTDTIVREYHEPAILERRQRQKQDGPSQDLETSGPQDPTAPAPPDVPTRPAPSEAQRKDRLVLAELSEARLLRAVYSERQLQEVLTDFWFNHFNVFAGKGPTRAYITAFERDAIRPHVLGDFRQMLGAVAESPAMLFYLDNWQNVSPSARQPRAIDGVQAGPTRPRQPADRASQLTAGMRRGINENYARELLELHTLGVDGGYTQDDVVNVARAFTGWTMRPRQGATFFFAPALHDRGPKTVLGHTIEAGGGIEDARRVLDLLAAHPSTAVHIARKLAQKFVSDTPPPALVERAARRFRETRGNLREVTRTIITSPEFHAADVRRTKMKTPLEFVASALRATGADVRTALPVVRVLRDLGMPLYLCQPPTGYDEAADAWVSSGALVARMNFALELGGGRLRGITVSGSGGQVDALRQRLIEHALADDVSDTTRATVAKATSHEQVVALVIGSPEFQRQ